MSQTKVSPIAPEEEIPFMNVDQTDFTSFTRGQLIRHLEVEGYAIFPRILNAEQIARLKAELAGAEMTHKSYSTYQTYAKTQPQWVSRAAAELIAHPPVIEFLTALMGPDIVFTRGFFQRTHPGSQCTRTVSRMARTCSVTRAAAPVCCEFSTTSMI